MLGHKNVLRKYTNRRTVNKLLNALCPCNRTARSRTRFYFKFSLNNYIRDEIAEYYYFKSKYTHEERLYEQDYPTVAHPCHPYRTLRGQGHARRLRGPIFQQPLLFTRGYTLVCPQVVGQTEETQDVSTWPSD